MGRMQQESSREMENGGMNSIMPHSHSSQVLLEELHQQQQNGQQQYDESQNSHQHDDFMEQMLSTIPNCPWPPHPHDNPNAALKSSNSPPDDHAAFQYSFDEASLASKLQQQQQIGNGAAAKAMMLQQQQFLLSRGLRPPLDPGMLPLPLSLGGTDPADAPPSNFPPTQGGGDASVQALYSGFTGSLHGNGQPPNQPQFNAPPPPTGGAGNNVPPASASTGGSSGAAPQRQRVRARRGQATDPHSIAERLRRERIAERMKALQELVPNANKTDKASMLDEIIDYVKFLQLQVKVLSMSRLGGAGAVGPLVADRSAEGGALGRTTAGNPAAAGNDNMSVSEHQVAKLMEEDMGSAMQYLQGKGLCLMPISLATAISTATCQSRNPLPPSRALINPNPSNNINNSMSGLTVQSTTVPNGPPAADDPAKDAPKL